MIFTREFDLLHFFNQFLRSVIEKAAPEVSVGRYIRGTQLVCIMDNFILFFSVDFTTMKLFVRHFE